MTPQEQAFRLFCGNADRVLLFANPCRIGDMVYATNAYYIIRTANCDFQVTQVGEEKWGAVYKPHNRNNLLSITADMFDGFKTVDEYREEGNNVHCTECDFDGMVEWIYKTYTRIDECPICNGTGFKELAKKVRTGNKTFDNQYVQMYDCYFFMKLFYRLIEVQKLLGGDIRLVYYKNPESVSIFTIGGCEIGIMPCDILYDEGVLDITEFIK